MTYTTARVCSISSLIVAIVIACGGGGASSTQSVGPEGGEVRLGVVTLTIPAGALDKTVDIVITDLGDVATPGYTACAHVYSFAPNGLEFSKPVEVSFQKDSSCPAHASVFWTKKASDKFESVGGTTKGTTITAPIEHFSQGFPGVIGGDASGGGAGGSSTGSGGSSAGSGGSSTGSGGSAGSGGGGAGSGGSAGSGGGSAGSGGGSAGSGGSGGCAMTYTYYSDGDNDGFGNAGSPIVSCSATPPAGTVANASDCNDTTALVKPNQTNYYSTAIATGPNAGTFDYDCSGSPVWKIGALYSASTNACPLNVTGGAAYCMANFNGVGWLGGVSPPNCGQTGTLITNCVSNGADPGDCKPQYDYGGSNGTKQACH